MWLQIGGGVLRVGAVVVASQMAPNLITETFAVSGAAFYLGMIALVYVYIREVARP
jgi:hypothetical protein